MQWEKDEDTGAFVGPRTFPSMDDDVEFGAVSEQQEAHFRLVEEQIKKVVTPGLSATLAKGQADQLNEGIKALELRDATRMSEEQFGRKLYKNVQQTFRLVLGTVMLAIVETNFPIERYIERRTGQMAKIQEYLEMISLSYTTVLKPDYSVYKLKIELEFADWQHSKNKGRATKLKPKGKGESVAPATEVETSDGEEEQNQKRTIEHKFNRKFLEEMDKHEKYLSAKDRYDKESERGKRQIAKQTAFLTILEGIRTAMSLIVSKIRAAVKDHDKVKQKLTSMVVLPLTGETIMNAYENGSLAGLHAILKSEYAKPTLVRFNADLQSTMKLSISSEDVTKNPSKAVQLTDDALATWLSMDYWEYMTPDIFWTNILLMSIPSSPFQTDCVKEVQEYIEGRRRGDVSDTATVASGGVKRSFPTYTYLSDYIKRCEDSARHHRNMGNYTAQRKQNTSYTGLKFGNVETAASSGAEYTAEVGRDMNVKCKDVTNGREYPYTATKEACPVCQGRDKDAANKHFPKCYGGTCHICGLYGHKVANCGQAPNTYIARKTGGVGKPSS